MAESISSQYQGSANPGSTYQPDIASSDGDYKDEQKALTTYQKTYGTQGSSTWTPPGDSTSGSGSDSIPTLSMAYTTSPDLIPLPDTGGSSSGGPTAPQPQFPVFIELATLMATENSFLGATKTLVDSYESTLLPAVQNSIDNPTIWGTNVTTGQDNNGDNKASWLLPSGYQADPLDKEGQKFASKLNPAMGKLLNSIGSVIEAMGVFTSLINTAGQYYTQADAQSVFPPPGLMEGPNPPTGP
jgi:hypothetical protein